MSGALLVVYGASIYGLVNFIKAIAKSIGKDKCPYFVRTLPLLPFVIGLVTGPSAVPQIAAQGGMDVLAGLSTANNMLVGLGVGSFAGQMWKVISQTIKGVDQRI